MTKGNSIATVIFSSLSIAVVLSLINRGIMLLTHNVLIEAILQITALVLSLLYLNKVNNITKQQMAFIGLSVSLICTLSGAHYHQELHPKSADSMHSIGSTLLLALNYYYLFLAGIITSFILYLIKPSPND